MSSDDLPGLMRFMFLSFEFITFLMIVVGNFLFLAVRMILPN